MLLLIVFFSCSKKSNPVAPNISGGTGGGGSGGGGGGNGGGGATQQAKVEMRVSFAKGVFNEEFDTTLVGIDLIRLDRSFTPVNQAEIKINNISIPFKGGNADSSHYETGSITYRANTTYSISLKIGDIQIPDHFTSSAISSVWINYPKPDTLVWNDQSLYVSWGISGYSSYDSLALYLLDVGNNSMRRFYLLPFLARNYMISSSDLSGLNGNYLVAVAAIDTTSVFRLDQRVKAQIFSGVVSSVSIKIRTFPRDLIVKISIDYYKQIGSDLDWDSWGDPYFVIALQCGIDSYWSSWETVRSRTWTDTYELRNPYSYNFDINDNATQIQFWIQVWDSDGWLAGGDDPVDYCPESIGTYYRHTISVRALPQYFSYTGDGADNCRLDYSAYLVGVSLEKETPRERAIFPPLFSDIGKVWLMMN